jgi:two-component system, NarL family, response regulator DevR
MGESGRGIRVMIVDDHEIVRTGLRLALEIEPDIAVAGEAASGEEFLRLVGSVRPDVVLMDVLMAGMGGIEACRLAKADDPALQVLMLTSHADEQAVVAAVLAGASGYLLKNVGRADLLKALRTVAAGGALLDPGVTRAVTSKLVDLSRQARQAEADPLSEREREVLHLVARGLTNKEIAYELHITEKTARNHISHILEKLNLSRRTEAAAYAVQRKLVQLPEPKDDEG